MTNRFISSFWYADALGLLATLNHTGFCRQTLIGGNYGLLNRTTAHPNPDFFIAQLFHDLMGERVLSFTSDVKKKGLRTYAHCESGLGGNATLLLINVSPTVTFTAQIGAMAAGMEVFVLSAGDGAKAKWEGLDSQHIKLNGQMLQGTDEQLLPPLVPKAGAAAALSCEPLTITFARVRGVKACE